jgi:hypothetical protein
VGKSTPQGERTRGTAHKGKIPDVAGVLIRPGNLCTPPVPRTTETNQVEGSVIPSIPCRSPRYCLDHQLAVKQPSAHGRPSTLVDDLRTCVASPAPFAAAGELAT